jgi:hypothetical protein
MNDHRSRVPSFVTVPRAVFTVIAILFVAGLWSVIDSATELATNAQTTAERAEARQDTAEREAELERRKVEALASRLEDLGERVTVRESPGDDAAPTVLIEGPKGDRGARGADGRPGRDGTDGAPGAVGETGATGATGATGRGIADVECSPNGQLVIIYTDGETDPVGEPGTCVPAPPEE